MTVGEKIERLESTFKEVAIGYNDSGCFWHFQYGGRGAGNMIAGIGERFNGYTGDSLDAALDSLLAHLANPYPSTAVT